MKSGIRIIRAMMDSDQKRVALRVFDEFLRQQTIYMYLIFGPPVVYIERGDTLYVEMPKGK